VNVVRWLRGTVTLPALVVGLACGSVEDNRVVQDASGAGGSSGGDGVGQAGGFVGSSTVGSGAAGGGGDAGAGSGGEGGISPCLDPFIDLSGDGADQHLTHACKGSFGQSSLGPSGFVAHDALTGSVSLGIYGCADDGLPSPGVALAVSEASAAGVYQGASLYYTDLELEHHDDVPPGATVTITTLEAVGGIIEGAFEVAVEGQGQPMQLSGAFRVCRIEDVYGGD
jgi:hypothetical protein